MRINLECQDRRRNINGLKEPIQILNTRMKDGRGQKSVQVDTSSYMLFISLSIVGIFFSYSFTLAPDSGAVGGKRRINSMQRQTRNLYRAAREFSTSRRPFLDYKYRWLVVGQSGLVFRAVNRELYVVYYGKSSSNRTPRNQGRAQTFAVGVPQRALAYSPSYKTRNRPSGL